MAGVCMYIFPACLCGKQLEATCIRNCCCLFCTHFKLNADLYIPISLYILLIPITWCHVLL